MKFNAEDMIRHVMQMPPFTGCTHAYAWSDAFIHWMHVRDNMGGAVCFIRNELSQVMKIRASQKHGIKLTSGSQGAKFAPKFKFVITKRVSEMIKKRRLSIVAVQNEQPKFL